MVKISGDGLLDVKFCRDKEIRRGLTIDEIKGRISSEINTRHHCNDALLFPYYKDGDLAHYFKQLKKEGFFDKVLN